MANSLTVNPTATRLPSDLLAGATAATTQPPASAAGQDDNATSSAAAPGDTSAAVGELVDALKTTSISLRFEIDESTHRVITKVIDKETGELIRQMPTAEVMRIARAIDKLQGLFVSQAV